MVSDYACTIDKACQSWVATHWFKIALLCQLLAPFQAALFKRMTGMAMECVDGGVSTLSLARPVKNTPVVR